MLRRLTPLMNADGGQGGGNPDPAPQPQPFEFDYEKLASIVNGKQAVAEDTVLKNYFKGQGVTKEEMDQAIKAYKDQKAQNTPDVNALQSQLTDSQKLHIRARVENEALLMSTDLGVTLKTMPYVIKMADLSAVVGDDGKIDTEKVKEALTKVLDDIPSLKASTQGDAGFKFGNDNKDNKGNNATDEDIMRAFGLSK